MTKKSEKAVERALDAEPDVEEADLERGLRAWKRLFGRRGKKGKDD